MDGVFGKLGVYDFFGILITGVLTLSMGYYLRLPPLLVGLAPKDAKVIAFLAESYFFGLVLRELGSLMDDRLFQCQKNSQRNYLSDLERNSVVRTKLELDSFRREALAICAVGDTAHVFTADEQESVFRYCRTCLEIHKQDGKEKMHDSLRAMSRSLTLAFAVLPPYYMLLTLSSMGDVVEIEAFAGMMVKILLSNLLAFLFYKRFAWLCRHRVAEVLRRYCVLIKQGPQGAAGGG